MVIHHVVVRRLAVVAVMNETQFRQDNMDISLLLQNLIIPVSVKYELELVSKQETS